MGANMDTTGRVGSTDQIGWVVSGLETVYTTCMAAIKGDPLAFAVEGIEGSVSETLTDQKVPVEFTARSLAVVANGALDVIRRLQGRADGADAAYMGETEVTASLEERNAVLTVQLQEALSAVAGVGAPTAMETAPEDVYEAYAAAEDAEDAEDAAFHVAMRKRRFRDGDGSYSGGVNRG